MSLKRPLQVYALSGRIDLSGQLDRKLNLSNQAGFSTRSDAPFIRSSLDREVGRGIFSQRTDK